MKTALVIFDCDGVLIDSEAIACRVLREALAEAGAHFGLDEVTERFAGWSDADVAAAVLEERGIALGDDFPLAVARRAVTAFERELRAVDGAPGLLEAFPWLKCVASNSVRERLERSLEIVGLRSLFPHGAIFSAEAVARPKPAPDLHLHAASRMGVTPDRCLVIEDSASGVRAARAAGIAVCGFTGAGHSAPGQAERLRALGAFAVIDDLLDVPKIIASLDVETPPNA